LHTPRDLSRELCALDVPPKAEVEIRFGSVRHNF